VRGFGGTCCSLLQGGKLRSVTHVLEMRATCAFDTYPSNYTASQHTRQKLCYIYIYIYVCVCVCVYIYIIHTHTHTYMICVSGRQQPLKTFCTADILWRPTRSCSRCSDVLRHKTVFIRSDFVSHSSVAHPYKALIVVRARKNCLATLSCPKKDTND